MSTLRRIAASVVGVALMGSLCSVSAAVSSHTVSAGQNWQVDNTLKLNSLTIEKGAALSAPAGHSLTLTVDGVEREIAAGNYHGHIVLSVTTALDLKMAQAQAGSEYRAALVVDNGHYQPAASVAAGISGGHVTDHEASDIAVRSEGPLYSGVIVTGDSHYVLRNATFDMNGNGGNDMAGWGAAVVAAGHADLTLDHVRIITHGAARNALFVAGHATVHVNDSDIETYNGTLPPGLLSPFDGGSGPSMEVPWMLGLTGNVRATNVIENGTVYYNNSHFRSQGWGVLSADAPTHIRMVVTNSTIENLESGYGAFTIGDTLDTFSHCTFNVIDVGLIVTGFGSALITDGTVINSRRFGVMMHTNDGKFGTVTIDKGSEINSRSTAIEIKGRGVNLIVDGAQLNPGNGVLIEAIPNDDPNVGGYGAQATVDAMLEGTPGSEKIKGMGMPPPPGSAGAGGPPGAPGPGAPGAPPPPGAAGSGEDPGGRMSGPVLATFKDVKLSGDIVNARTRQGSMVIALQDSELRGAVTTAIAEPASHGKPTKAHNFYIGEVKNIFQPTHEKYGLEVSVGDHSQWIVDQTSYLTHLVISADATVRAPEGFALTLSVDGVERPLQAGQFKGHVVLRVVPAGS